MTACRVHCPSSPSHVLSWQRGKQGDERRGCPSLAGQKAIRFPERSGGPSLILGALLVFWESRSCKFHVALFLFGAPSLSAAQPSLCSSELTFCHHLLVQHWSRSRSKARFYCVAADGRHLGGVFTWYLIFYIGIWKINGRVWRQIWLLSVKMGPFGWEQNQEQFRVRTLDQVMVD